MTNEINTKDGQSGNRVIATVVGGFGNRSMALSVWQVREC